MGMGEQTCSVKTFVFASSERVPLLSDSNAQLLFHTTLFITTRAGEQELRGDVGEGDEA